MIQNVAINADQAMPEGGILNIRTSLKDAGDGNKKDLSPGKYISIEIEDNGPGIDKETLGKVFDPFFTTKSQGSGLGLAISHSIIKKHGGTINIKSGKEKGTIVSIMLPVIKPANQIAEEPESLEPLSGQGRILILDDDKLVIQTAKGIIENLGYKTDTADKPSNAIEKYRNEFENGNRYKFVIMDLTIPGDLGGKDVVKELLKIDPDVRAIVSSGYSTDPVMANYRDYGFTGILEKPYRTEEIVNLIRKIEVKEEVDHKKLRTIS